MAVNRQNQQDIKDTATYVEDTLRSVASNIGIALKDAVAAAFDEKDATVLSSVGKDFSRSMMAAARSSEDLVQNSSRLRQGLLSSKDVSKQLEQLEERRTELSRRFLYITDLAKETGREISNREKEDYQQALKALDVQKSILDTDLERTRTIEKTIGLTGKLVNALGKIPGVGQFINAAEIEQEMRKVANSTESTFASMGVAAKMIGSQLLSGLTDPAFLLSEILNTYLAINKASVDLQRYTGQNEVEVSNLNMSYASLQDYLETSLELTQQFGRTAANVFSKDIIAGAAEIKLLMGLTAEEAGGLALLSQTNKTSVQGTTDSIVKQVNSFNGLNRTAVNHRMVMEDVATASDSVKLSLGNSATSIADAAASARRLGLSLQEVDQIAGSLLNFETSIGQELEAELLTGKNLNLERARELALRNEFGDLGKEILNNSADIYEFGRMNRLQQESYAEALGLSRDQLAKIAYNRAIDLNMTEEQAAAAANVNAEEMKRLNAMENFQKAIEKIAGAFAPLLDVVGSLLNIPWVPYVVLGALAAVKAFNFLGVSVGRVLGSMIGLSKVSDTAAGGLGKGGFLGNINTTSLIKGAASILIISGALYVFAKSLQELEQIKDWKQVAIGLGAFAAAMGTIALVGAPAAAGLEALGVGFSAFGAAMLTGAGAIGLAAFAATVLVLGGALNLAAPGIEAFGHLLSSITMDSIAPMLLIGPALYNIAGGLAAVATAGMLALPAIGGLFLLSKATPGLVTLGAGGQQNTVGSARKKAEEGSLAAVEAKLDALISVVKQGTNIYLDGKQISRSVNRNLPVVTTFTK